MKTIYLVIEQGTGIILRAFEEKQKAEQMVERLKEQTDMDCFEIHEVILE